MSRILIMEGLMDFPVVAGRRPLCFCMAGVWRESDTR
jgi:hypothetical protein